MLQLSETMWFKRHLMVSAALSLLRTSENDSSREGNIRSIKFILSNIS